MSNNNTLLYVALGVGVVFVLSKKKTPVLPGQSVTMPLIPATTPVAAGGSVLLALLGKLTSVLPSSTATPPDSVFTPIQDQGTQSPTILNIFDSTGTESFSNGSVFDPNNNNTLDLPITLTPPVLPTSDPTGTDSSDD